MSFNRVVAIGASAGGVRALCQLAASLPEDLPCPVLVVMHIPPYRWSELPRVLSRCGPLPALNAEDGAPLRIGEILVAPADHHLLVDDGRIAVRRGPKENRFRPSIDALLRSVAYDWRERAIGVVLSGLLDDGTSGLWTIKRLGGVAIVQDPGEAEFDAMPRAAIAHASVDFELGATEIGKLIGRLACEPVVKLAHPASDQFDRMGTEIAVAGGESGLELGIMEKAKNTPYTCPECHGALFRIDEGSFSRFRCHAGHAYSESALIQAGTQSTAEYLSQAMRGCEETLMLLNEIANRMDGPSSISDGDILRRMVELESQAKVLREAIHKHDMFSGESVSIKGGNG